MGAVDSTKDVMKVQQFNHVLHHILNGRDTLKTNQILYIISYTRTLFSEGRGYSWSAGPPGLEPRVHALSAGMGTRREKLQVRTGFEVINPAVEQVRGWSIRVGR